MMSTTSTSTATPVAEALAPVTRVEVTMPALGTAENCHGDLFTVGEVWWQATPYSTQVTAFGLTITGEQTNRTYFGDDLPDWMPQPPAEFTALATRVEKARA